MLRRFNPLATGLFVQNNIQGNNKEIIKYIPVYECTFVLGTHRWISSQRPSEAHC